MTHVPLSVTKTFLFYLEIVLFLSPGPFYPRNCSAESWPNRWKNFGPIEGGLQFTPPPLKITGLAGQNGWPPEETGEPVNAYPVMAVSGGSRQPTQLKPPASTSGFHSNL